jgi:hypothetical protein
MEYLVAAANLHAYNYGIKGTRDPAVFRKVIESMEVPVFTPKSGVKIQINENEPVPQGNDDGESSYPKARVYDIYKRGMVRADGRQRMTLTRSWLPCHHLHLWLASG